MYFPVVYQGFGGSEREDVVPIPIMAASVPPNHPQEGSPPNNDGNGKAKEISMRLQNLLHIPSTSLFDAQNRPSFPSPMGNQYYVQSSPNFHQGNSGMMRPMHPPGGYQQIRPILGPQQSSDAGKENMFRHSLPYIKHMSAHKDSIRLVGPSIQMQNRFQEPGTIWNNTNHGRGPDHSQVHPPPFRLSTEQRIERENNMIATKIERLIISDLENIYLDLPALKYKYIKDAIAMNRATFESVGKNLDPHVRDFLRRNGINLLIKRAVRFPRAKFYCCCCNYHMDNLVMVLDHLMQIRHISVFKPYVTDVSLMNTPIADKSQATAIANLITKVVHEHGMSAESQRARIALANRLQDMTDELELDCKVSLFGSSATGLGFNESDININVTIAVDKIPEKNKGKSVADYLEQKIALFVNAVKQQSDFLRVVESYTFSKIALKFETLIDDRVVNCAVQFNNNNAVLLAELFCEYVSLDERVRPVVLATRYLARICAIDDQEEGYLPSHGFVLMCIHFLQQVDVVPVLHHVIRPTGKPFGSAQQAIAAGWKPVPASQNYCIGELWLSLLRYLAVEFNYKDTVLTVTRKGVLLKGDKTWNRRISIEDPIVPTSNMARSTANNKSCDIILDIFRAACLYYNIPRVKNGPLYDGVILDLADNEPELGMTIRHIRALTLPVDFDSGRSLDQDPRDVFFVDLEVGELVVPDSPKADELNTGMNLAQVLMSRRISSSGKPEMCIVKSHTTILQSIIRLTEYSYGIIPELFWNGGPPPRICKACGSENHSRKNCPQEILPEPLLFQYPNVHTMNKMFQTLARNFDIEKMSAAERELRHKIAHDMTALLIKEFPDVQLTLYGSSMSGFEVRQSDVDICMTLQRFPDGFDGAHKPDIGPVTTQESVLKSVVTSLITSSEFKDIHPITTAKVPIIKFIHISSRMEGDISLYNTLALYNTELLSSYAQLDIRVKVLGCFLKKLTKLCEISDASKGALSSYAYIIMLIHFLQQRRPPVLPVLQEIPPIGWDGNKELPVVEKDNWNVYFFKDFSKLSQVWRNPAANTETIAELWLGFLNYYIHDFDFENNVITISSLTPPTRREKMWFTGCIAIEDPFEKTHNLGSGLSKRMSVYILKTFQQFAKVFHTDMTDLDLEECFDYYVDVNRLKKGTLPIDRQCRICHHIGHIARNCTVKPLVNGNVVYVSDEDDERVSSTSTTTVTPSVGSSFNSTMSQQTSTVVPQQSPVEVPMQPILQPFQNNLIRPTPFHFHMGGMTILPAQQLAPHPGLGPLNFPPMRMNLPVPVMNNQDAYMYFWDDGKGIDAVGDILIRMIQISSGVLFERFVQERFCKLTNLPPQALLRSIIPIVRPHQQQMFPIPIINGTIPIYNQIPPVMNAIPGGGNNFMRPQMNPSLSCAVFKETTEGNNFMGKIPPPGFTPVGMTQNILPMGDQLNHPSPMNGPRLEMMQQHYMVPTTGGPISMPIFGSFSPTEPGEMAQISMMPAPENFRQQSLSNMPLYNQNPSLYSNPQMNSQAVHPGFMTPRHPPPYENYRHPTPPQ